MIAAIMTAAGAIQPAICSIQFSTIGFHAPRAEEQVRFARPARLPEFLSLADLTFQVAMLMVVYEPAERGLVNLDKYVREFLVRLRTRRERRSVDLAERAHERVTVLTADLAIFVAMATFQTRLFHKDLLLNPLILSVERTKAWRGPTVVEEPLHCAWLLWLG